MDEQTKRGIQRVMAGSATMQLGLQDLLIAYESKRQSMGDKIAAYEAIESVHDAILKYAERLHEALEGVKSL